MYLKWLVFLNRLNDYFTETSTHIVAFVENRDTLIRSCLDSEYEVCLNKARDELKKHPLPEDPEGVLYLRFCKKAVQTSSTLERIENNPEYSFSTFIVILLCTAFIYFMVGTSRLAVMPISIVFIVVVIAVLISFGGGWLKHKIVIKHLAALDAAIEFLSKRDQRCSELDLAEMHRKSCYDVMADSIGEVPRM